MFQWAPARIVAPRSNSGDILNSIPVKAGRGSDCIAELSVSGPYLMSARPSMETTRSILDSWESLEQRHAGREPQLYLAHVLVLRDQRLV